MSQEQARQDMQTSAVPSNTVICTVEPGFFDNQAAEMQLMSRAEACGELHDIVVNEEELKLKFIYEDQTDAVKARVQLHNFVFHGHQLDTDFGKPLGVQPPQMCYLQVPELTKQFLISPPASPPIGWEPGTESPPVVNHELEDRLLSLKNDPYHILHEGSGVQPSIVVENCTSPSRSQSPHVENQQEDLEAAVSDSGSAIRAPAAPSQLMPSITIDSLGPSRSTGIPPTQCPPRTKRPPAST